MNRLYLLGASTEASRKLPFFVRTLYLVRLARELRNSFGARIRTWKKTVQIKQTQDFVSWFDGLRDLKGQARIAMRIKRFANENYGDAKPVGQGVSEARIDVGPGYRVYFVVKAEVVLILLCGGDKSTQQSDIARAHKLAAELE